jgi:hypothetical protein
MSQTFQDEKVWPNKARRKGIGAREQSAAILGPENEGSFYEEEEERRFTRISGNCLNDRIGAQF